MRIPPTSFVRLQNAFRRGDHLRVIADGDDVARQLASEGHDTSAADAALMIGISHAAYERLAVACTYLEYGLDAPREAPRDAASRGPARDGFPDTRPAWVRSLSSRARRSSAPPPPLTGLTGTTGPYDAATYGAGSPGGLAAPAPHVMRAPRPAPLVETAELVLVDLYLQLGRYRDAVGRITPLLDPGRSVTTRFTATRAQAAIAALRAEYETAHHLLNTAAGLAGRVPSRFRSALVEGDRAGLLAAQGRGYEAVTAADRVLGSLVRPPVGEYQVWANAEAASIALTLSRLAAHAGDLLTAQRMLRVGQQAAQPLGRAYFSAHAELAGGVIAAADGDPDQAEGAFLSARRTFEDYGYRPAAALAVLEQGRLAHRRGLARSARPLYERAFAEFRALDQPSEGRLVRRLLAELDSSQTERRAPLQRPTA